MATSVESVTIDVTLDDFVATLDADGVLSELSPPAETLGTLIAYPTCTPGADVTP
jgi:hypothetical protein